MFASAAPIHVRKLLALPPLDLTIHHTENQNQRVAVGVEYFPHAKDIKPGETVERVFYPRGQMPGTLRIAVEVEASIQPDSERFFKELQ